MKAVSRFTGLAAAAMFAFVATSAQADVFVTATFDKTFTKQVFEVIEIFKDIDVFVTVDTFPDAAAESEAVKNQRNQYNVVEEFEADSLATIQNSGTGAAGILNFNQSPGNLNNQGNEVSLAGAQTPFFEGVFAHSNASVQQINGGEPFNGEGGNQKFEEGGVYTDEIIDSFGDAFGIVGVNQSANDMNNQNNAVSVAVGDFTTVSLSEADLGQWNTYNFIDTFQSVRTDSITGSFNGFTGVAGVNQSAGAMNNQANVVSVATSTGIAFGAGITP